LAGGIAALLALAGLGLAGAARSSAFAAACADLSRFPFPRFRVLPCPNVGGPSGTSSGNVVAAGPAHSRPTTTNHAPSPGGAPSSGAGAGSLPLLPPLPRVGGVLGAAVTKAPWSIVKGIVVAVLAVINAFVLGIRWRVGRLHAR